MLPQKHLCGSALEVLLWQLAYLCGVPPSLRRFGGVRDQKKWSGGPQWAKVTAPAPLQGISMWTSGCHMEWLRVHLQGLSGAALGSASWNFALRIRQCCWAVTFALWAHRPPLTWQGDSVSPLSSLTSMQTLTAIRQQGLALGHLLWDLVKLVFSLSGFLTGQRYLEPQGNIFHPALTMTSAMPWCGGITVTL